MSANILESSRAKVHVLLLSPSPQEQAFLRAAFDSGACEVHSASSYREAFAVLDACRPCIVICESTLPDGNWKALLTEAGRSSGPLPLVIVTSHLADNRLWSEVLNFGGYDVLAKPFDRAEVSRVLDSARHHCQSAA